MSKTTDGAFHRLKKFQLTYFIHQLGVNFLTQYPHFCDDQESVPFEEVLLLKELKPGASRFLPTGPFLTLSWSQSNGMNIAIKFYWTKQETLNWVSASHHVFESLSVILAPGRGKSRPFSELPQSRGRQLQLVSFVEIR